MDQLRIKTNGRQRSLEFIFGISWASAILANNIGTVDVFNLCSIIHWDGQSDVTDIQMPKRSGHFGVKHRYFVNINAWDTCVKLYKP